MVEKPSIGRMSTATLVALNQRLAATIAVPMDEAQGTVVDVTDPTYVVFWSGFISSAYSSRLISRVTAWAFAAERAQVPRDRRLNVPPYLVKIVRGRAFGTYEPGAYWDIRTADYTKPHWTRETLTDPERWVELCQDVRGAFDELCALAKFACEQARSGGVVSLPKASCLDVVAIDPRTGIVVADSCWDGAQLERRKPR